ncbi:MAG: hypothetical protein WCO35_01595 [Candidatus Nomurabacteria bacterium]
MILEIYSYNLIIYSILAFLFGVIVAYATIIGNTGESYQAKAKALKFDYKMEFDFFLFFKNLGLDTLFNSIWTMVVKIFSFVGINLDFEIFNILYPKKK